MVSIIIRNHLGIIIWLLFFLRSTRRRNFPMGFLCAKMGQAYFEKSRTMMIPYLCIWTNSAIKSSFRWIGIGKFWLLTALSSSGVSLTLNSVFIPMSILCLASMSWYSTRMSSTPGFLVLWAVWLSNEIAREISFENLRHLLGSVFFLPICAVLWGFVSVLGCDPQFYRDFRASENRMSYFVALVCFCWIICSSKYSDPDQLPKSYWELPWKPAWWVWVAPEWLHRIWQFPYFSCFNMVIPLCWWLWLLFFCELLLTLKEILADSLLP